MSCGNAEGVKEFIRLAGVRHLTHRDEPRLDRDNAGLREGGQDRLAYSRFRPVRIYFDSKGGLPLHDSPTKHVEAARAISIFFVVAQTPSCSPSTMPKRPSKAMIGGAGLFTRSRP